MKRLIFLLTLLAPVSVLAQATGSIQGYCDLGGRQATIAGLNSSNYLQGVIPHCLVSVYLTGSQTLATIYKDGSNTPLTNPFKATTISSTQTGHWLFYAAQGQGYDVQLSGGDPPLVFPSPVVAAVDVFASGGTGSGGSCSPNIISAGCTGGTSAPAAQANILGNPAAGLYAINCTSSSDCQPSILSSAFFYQTVQANTVSLTQEARLNLKSGSNSTVSCVDNPGNNSTDCTISSTGGSTVTWPTSGDVVISNGTNTPTGLPPQLGLCLSGVAGPVWGDGPCVSSLTTIGTSGASTFNTVTGALNIPVYTGGGGGGGNIPSNAIFVFTGTSMNFDDSHVLSTAVTITGWTTSTGVTTVTNSGTNNFSAGQWVDMVAATSWPVNGTYNSGTGTRIFQVLSSGLSSTQFEINTSGISAGSCASTCGSAYSASAYLPYATTASVGMPAAAPTNTYAYCSVTDPSGHACTLYGIATNYTNMLHSISPVVTGIPGYLIINGPNNDLGLNYTLTNIETYYQTIFADAHTDGWTVMVGSPTGANINQSGANNFSAYQSAIDEWLRGQGKTTVQAVTPGSSQYWDLWTDVGNQLWDGSNTDIIASNTGLGPDGAKMAALTIATDLENGNGRPLPRRVGDWWTQPVGAGSTGNTSYAFVPSVPASSQVILYRWFTSSAMTTNAAELTTGGAFWAQQIVAGTGGGGLWSNCPASWPFCVKTSGGETFSVADNGVVFGASGFTAASGGSNSNAWNTNGGATAIPSAVAALPPYEQIGSTLYIPADGMFTANLPPSSPTWINSVAPGTITPQTNGDLILGTAATSTDYFLEEIGGGTSVEAVVNNLYTASATKNASISVWIYDSTNSKVWAFGPVAPIASSSVGQFSISSYTYSGSGNPSFGSGTAVGFGVAGWGSPIHLKIVTAGGTASFEVCINGGLSCKVFGTESVGTISDGGIHVYDGGSNQVTDVLSLKVQ